MIQFAKAGLRLKGNLVFVFVANEEAGGDEYGFKYLVNKGYFNDTDCMIYGGAGMRPDGVFVASNGQLETKVTVRGRTAHTMFLEEGVNSIVAASKVISRLQELADIVNKRNHPLTGSSRMSINMIQGGSKINVLPDTCVITIDRRLNPYENPEEAKKEIQNALDKLKREEPKLDVELATRLTFPAVVSDSKAEIVRLLIETAHEITGLESKQ